MNPILDFLWNLPALPALILWGAPIEGFVIWLVWNTRATARKASSFSNLIPEIPKELEPALAWSIRRAIDHEVDLYYTLGPGRGKPRPTS